MRQITLTLILAAGICPLAIAQEAPDALPLKTDRATSDSAASAAEASPANEAKPAKKPKKAKAPWTFRVAMRNVFDSNIDQNEEDLYSRGLITEAGVKYKNKTPVGDLELDYKIGAHFYTNTEKWTRTTHNVEGVLDHKLSDQWRAQTTGEVAVRDASDDGDIRDVHLLEQRLEYRITPVYRVRARGALRNKKYDDDPRRDSHDPYYGLEIVQKYPNGWRWDTEYRYDRNRADDGRFSYKRRTFETTVGRTLNDRSEVSLRARYRVRRYDERWVSTSSGVAQRRDRYNVLRARWDYKLQRRMDLRLDYEFETRRSNDDGNDFDDHVLTTTLTKRW